MTAASTSDTRPATLRAVPRDTPVSEIMKIYREDGGVVIKGYLTAEQVEKFNGDLDPHLGALSAGSKHNDAEKAEFHGSNTKRLTNLVTNCATFREDIVEDDLLHDLADATYLEESGAWWMGTAAVIEIGPGNKAQPLHRDLDNYFPFIGMGPAGPEVTSNALIALTTFTEENGATRILPGSHEWPDFNDRGRAEDTVPALLEAGDALWFSGKLAHGGGANVSADNYRRCVTVTLVPGYLTPEEAYPFLVERDMVETLSPRVQRMIGFRSQFPKGSPGLWEVDYAELADHLGLDG